MTRRTSHRIMRLSRVTTHECQITGSEHGSVPGACITLHDHPMHKPVALVHDNLEANDSPIAAAAHPRPLSQLHPFVSPRPSLHVHACPAFPSNFDTPAHSLAAVARGNTPSATPHNPTVPSRPYGPCGATPGMSRRNHREANARPTGAGSWRSQSRRLCRSFGSKCKGRVTCRHERVAAAKQTGSAATRPAQKRCRSLDTDDG